MPTFAYTARTLSGELKNATIETRPRARTSSRSFASRSSSSSRCDEEQKKKKRRAGIKTKDVSIFTRQFATMINRRPAAGAVPRHPEQAEREPGARKKSTPAGGVRGGVGAHAGRRAAASTRRCSTTCSSTWSRPARPAVSWTTILMRLATYIEKDDALIRKVKSAMVYPVVIMSVAFIAIVVLLDLRHPDVREHVHGLRRRCRCRPAS